MSRAPRRSLLRSLLSASLSALLPAVYRPRSARARITGPSANVAEPVRVSARTPFADGCEGAPLSSRVYRGSVMEPMVAVDPRDPRHLVAGWVQDRIATAAASGLMAAVSRDGGATWATMPMPFSHCGGGTVANGGDYRRASDPWITFSPSGRLFYAALAVNAFAGPATDSAILVCTSDDGGASWRDPLTIARTPVLDGFNDKPTITADPSDARHVYAVWNCDRPEERPEGEPGGSPLMFARSTDGGRSWEPGREIYAGPEAAMIGPVLVVLPSGQLVCLATRTVPAGGGEVTRDVIALRSEDRGVTWSVPTSVSRIVLTRLRDPYSTFPIQLDPAFAVIPAAAGDPRDRRLYVAWPDARFSEGAHTDIALSMSADGGRSWTAPVKVNQTTGGVPAFVPSIAVSGDGTVGVTYYDLRNTTPNQHAILTDYWLASCGADLSRAADWQEAHIGGSWDLARAAYGNGYFLGDFQGLTGVDGGFLMMYAAPSVADEVDFSAAYFTSVALP